MNFRKLFIFAAALCGLVLSGPNVLFAQVTGNDSISVTATNDGFFEFAIDDDAYAFGNVDAKGKLSNGVTGSDDADGATYEKTAASGISLSSAPVRTVRLSYEVSSNIVWGTEGRLEAQIPAIGANGTSCGYKTMNAASDADSGSNDCSAGNLYHGLSVGSDSAAVTGQVDLKLRVENEDGVGANDWTVTITASGI